MPKLHVIFDPKDSISAMPGELQNQLGIKVAILSIPADLEGIDIYHLAKRLAELLLEQV